MGFLWEGAPDNMLFGAPSLVGGLLWLPLGQWLATIAYAGIVLVVEPFYVGAGFAMYLNRRVELEAWDVEQEFRLAFAS